MLYSNLGLADGSFVDASPFKNIDAHWAIDELLKSGYGTEVMMMNGKTGQLMTTPWFIGSCFYQSLKHMVLDKIAARNRGPRAALTRQPLEGRAKQGGLRVGEMERDAILAHGASRTLDDRSRVASDGHSAPVCMRCGQIGETSTKFTLKSLLAKKEEVLQHEQRCRICDGQIRVIETTYCYSNLLIRELAATGIKVEHSFADSGVLDVLDAAADAAVDAADADADADAEPDVSEDVQMASQLASTLDMLS